MVAVNWELQYKNFCLFISAISHSHRSTQVEAWIEALIEAWIEEWIEAWIEEWIEAWIEEWIEALIEAWIEEWIETWSVGVPTSARL